MRAAIEWVTFDIGVMRGGPDFEVHGDPYNFSCTVIRRGDECELKGLSGKLPVAAARAIRECLNEQGINRANWDRLKPGLEKSVTAK